ncbi:MAG: nuclear transport factor 2 family protein [Verrucomicrobiota bacterium]
MSKFTIKIANADAEAVIEEFLDALEAISVERFLNVWHENGVQVMPYAPEGFPARLEGKKAIRRQYAILLAEYKSIRIPNRIFHFTNDPNRVWVELQSEIQFKATGKSYNNTYVCLFILRDGKIIEYKEYFNPLILLNSFDNPAVLRKCFGTPSKQ